MVPVHCAAVLHSTVEIHRRTPVLSPSNSFCHAASPLKCRTVTIVLPSFANGLSYRHHRSVSLHHRSVVLSWNKMMNYQHRVVMLHNHTVTFFYVVFHILRSQGMAQTGHRIQNIVPFLPFYTATYIICYISSKENLTRDNVC